MQSGVRLALAGWLLGLLAACQARESASLTIHAIEPRALEPGTALWLWGDGFEDAQRCHLELHGQTHRPGASSVKVDQRLAARRRSTHALQLALAPATWQQLGAQGSFDGTLRLCCARADGSTAVSPRVPLRLDLLQPLRRGTAHDRALEGSARRTLELAGVHPAEGEPTTHGLLVGALRRYGPAARAGLRSGDRLVRAGGVSVHALRDFALAPHQQSLELHVLRRDERTPVGIVLALDVGDARLDRRHLPTSLLAGLLLGCALLSQRLRARLRKLWLTRPHPGPGARIALWGGRVRPRRRGAGASVLLPTMLSAAGALLIYLEPPNFLALRSLSLYLGFAALSAVLTFMHGSGGSAQRRRAAAGLLGRLLVLGTVVACACAASGTKALDGIVAEQGGWPWTWSGMRNPALALALPLYIAFGSELGAATLPLPTPTGDKRSSAAARSIEHALIAERVVTNVALCALCVVMFAGGWQCPAQLVFEPVPPRLIGALLFVAKAWLCAMAFAHARSQRWAQRCDPRWTVVGCALIVVLTALWLALDDERTQLLGLFTARVLCSACGLLAAAGMLRWLRSASRAGRELQPVQTAAATPDG